MQGTIQKYYMDSSVLVTYSLNFNLMSHSIHTVHHALLQFRFENISLVSRNALFTNTAY